jgi:hypothetical protein
VFDFERAEALQVEAQELAQSLDFAPPLVSASIDMLLTLARQRDPGRAEKLLEETQTRIASTPHWHEWRWRLRLLQARAELALARRAFEVAVTETTHSINESHDGRRPKYEALGLVTRAHSLHALGRTHDAIADARRAVVLARETSDPALLLLRFDALLGFDGSDELAAEARALTDTILRALPDSRMRERFSTLEVAQRVSHL